MRSRTLLIIMLLASACNSREPHAREDQLHREAGSRTHTMPGRGPASSSAEPRLRQVDAIPQLIACGADDRTVCVADTTRAPDECCTGDAVADWILVMNRSDSLEFFVGPGSGVRRPDASITMQQIGRGRAFQEHDVNTASYLRYRFPEAGAYTLDVGVPSGANDTVAYELRIRQTTPLFDANLLRGFPLVFLDADSSARVAMLPRRPDGSDLSAFQVRPGWYRLIAPGLDSVFACRFPCTRVEAIALGARVSRLRL